mmetsp:Transcript_30929/g.100709  ORF Transcript_30929/g.100709 Transcript_30929/m.100709 type:complete len:395 (-) Transcript_30929:358-1542(-)
MCPSAIMRSSSAVSSCPFLSKSCASLEELAPPRDLLKEGCLFACALANAAGACASAPACAGVRNPSVSIRCSRPPSAILRHGSMMALVTWGCSPATTFAASAAGEATRMVAATFGGRTRIAMIAVLRSTSRTLPALRTASAAISASSKRPTSPHHVAKATSPRADASAFALASVSALSSSSVSSLTRAFSLASSSSRECTRRCRKARSLSTFSFSCMSAFAIPVIVSFRFALSSPVWNRERTRSLAALLSFSEISLATERASSSSSSTSSSLASVSSSRKLKYWFLLSRRSPNSDCVRARSGLQSRTVRGRSCRTVLANCSTSTSVSPSAVLRECFCHRCSASKAELPAPGLMPDSSPNPPVSDHDEEAPAAGDAAPRATLGSGGGTGSCPSRR